VLNPAHPTLTVGSPTYKWYKDNVLITGATLPTLTVSQAGTYKVEVGNAGGCSGTDEVVMGFHTLPALDIVGLNTSQCIDGAITTLQGTPAGGTFTVKGLSATTFNPASTGVGTHQVIYTYTDGNTCVNRDTLLATVHPLPVVAITGLQNEYCAIDALVPLVATPAGGNFTINDAPYTDTNLKLDVLGAGTYNIKYAYTDVNNCSNSASKTVIINPLPVLSFIDLQTDYCINFTPFALQASPTGGTFTIDGVTATTFTPATLGVGEHTVVYSFTDAKNCSQTKTQVVNVNLLPTPTITNLQEAYCQGQGLVTLQATPAGGTFTINGTLATDFNTVTMALGEYEVIYTYQDAKTCINRDTAVFTVVPSPIVEITGLQFVYCIDATPFNLTATPHPINPDGFGIFRIDGGAPVTQVVPSVLGAGIHTVEYTYTDTRTNCVVVQNKNFEISGLPSVSLVSIGGLKPTYCLGEAPFPLAGIGTPSGGVFTISGVIRSVFDPVAIGAGTHTVIYNYQDVNGCFNTASTEILIYEGVVPAIPNLKKNYCVQNTPFNLVGEPADGVFRIDGVLITEPNPLFSPAVLGVGEHTIVYKTVTACDSIVRKINIFDAPTKLNYAGLEMCSFSGDTITLDAGEGLLYEWSNLKTTRAIRVIQSGKYTVTVTDTLGCKTTSDIDIAEKCDPKFDIPTGFTPNGDGLNDYLQIFGQDFYKMEVKIYNRWGELVFITNKKQHWWDGTVGGKLAPAGVYVLTVKYLERPNDVERQFTSYVNLIR
jgi:gliding motility-associated-like protein